jgi:hypothetical protein
MENGLRKTRTLLRKGQKKKKKLRRKERKGLRNHFENWHETAKKLQRRLVPTTDAIVREGDRRGITIIMIDGRIVGDKHQELEIIIVAIDLVATLREWNLVRSMGGIATVVPEETTTTIDVGMVEVEVGMTISGDVTALPKEVQRGAEILLRLMTAIRNDQI